MSTIGEFFEAAISPQHYLELRKTTRTSRHTALVLLHLLACANLVTCCPRLVALRSMSSPGKFTAVYIFLDHTRRSRLASDQVEAQASNADGPVDPEDPGAKLCLQSLNSIDPQHNSLIVTYIAGRGPGGLARVAGGTARE